MWNWVERLEELNRDGREFVLVTLVSSSGSAPREAGAKMIVTPDGDFSGTIGGGHLEELALRDARTVLDDGKARLIKYPLGAKTGQCCGGVVDLFFEPMNRGPILYLFGAGHVGQAVCRVLSGTPFRVHLIDEREEWVISDNIPRGVVRHHGEWDDFSREFTWDAERTYVVVMTHRHDLDQEIIEFVVQKPVRYVGLIGSDSKWSRFKQRFEARGISEASYAKVRCPIGLDIGGKAPQEVAISLASELLKIHYGR